MINYSEAFPTLNVRVNPGFVTVAPTTTELVDIPDDTKAMTYRELKEWVNGLDEERLDQTMLLEMGRLVFAWGRPLTLERGGPGTYNPILVEKKKVDFHKLLSRSLHQSQRNPKNPPLSNGTVNKENLFSPGS